MSTDTHKIFNRRELLQKIGHTASLAGISLTAMYIYSRNVRNRDAYNSNVQSYDVYNSDAYNSDVRSSDVHGHNTDLSTGGSCKYDYLCGKCTLLRKCSLPAAYAYKTRKHLHSQ